MRKVELAAVVAALLAAPAAFAQESGTGGQAGHMAGQGGPMPDLSILPQGCQDAIQQSGMPGMMQGMDMSKMDMKGPFAKSEMDMHMKMMSAKGADVAETYHRKMIEHHRGALAMSQAALAQTRDPRTRATAQKVIAMQTKEIADLQAWLRSNNKRPQ